MRYVAGAKLTNTGPCFTFYKQNKQVIAVDFVSTHSPRSVITVTNQKAWSAEISSEWNIKWHISRGCEWTTKDKGQACPPLPPWAHLMWSTWRMGFLPVWCQEHLGALTGTYWHMEGKRCHCWCRYQAGCSDQGAFSCFMQQAGDLPANLQADATQLLPAYVRKT